MKKFLSIAVELAKIDIRRRYTKQFIGAFWGMLVPLGMAIVIGGVYGVLFQLNYREFLPYLFLNLILWSYISQCAESGASCFIAAEGYIKQMSGLSFFIYPLRTAITALFHLGMGLLASILVDIVLGLKFGFTAFSALPGILIWIALGYGLACISGVINTRFRDYANLQSILLQVVFYISPILYPARLLEARNMSILFKYNPLYYMLKIIDEPILKQGKPSLESIGISILVTTCVIIAGTFFISKVKRKIVFWL
jgi:lipopolysaccharide transport system permease protein